MVGVEQTQELHALHCKPYIPPVPLNQQQIKLYLQQISDWKQLAEEKSISRTFFFPDYPETIAFTHAAAWIAQQENHHPDISFSYNHCTVRYSTHSAQGLTILDFICAAKTDQLLINE